MIGKNLAYLRKQHGFSQEETAEHIGVSRQTVAKWESGDSLPDISNCAALAKLYGVTVDELITYSEDTSGLPIPPKGKYFFGKVSIDGEGRITIPEKAMRVFGLKNGDELAVLGDINQGIALTKTESILTIADVIRREKN